ncbi:hypothetical protein Tco_0849999, partial [Tanacetum coccineum]
MVSPFLCSNDSESDTEIPERHVSPTPHDAMLTRWRSRVASRSSSPTTSTLENPTAPILPAPSVVVAPSAVYAPSSEFPLAPVDAPLGIHHSSSGHSISGHSLFGHTSPDIIVADSSTPSRFVYLPLARTPQCSEAYLSWRSALLSTLYPPTTSESSARDSSSESSARPSHKRYRFSDSISPKDSVEEDIDTDVLDDIEADATAIEVAVDRNVMTGVDAGIDMKVDVGVDVEDEVESSDRGTMKVGVDVAVGIDILDAMLMADVIERLEQVEEGLEDIYDHVIEIPLQRIEDIEMGQVELESRSLIAGRERAGLLEQVASLERSNARLRGTMMMERARAD